jgi:hypothetical protein
MTSSRTKTSAASSACSTTLVAWCPAGSAPKSRQSSMWDIHESGCQLAIWPVVHAQRSDVASSPRCTTGLSVM